MKPSVLAQTGFSPQRVAVFRALQLGDLLCTIPAIRALRGAFPRAQVTLVGLPWAAAFVRRFPHYFTDFIPFAGYPGLLEQEINPRAIVDFLRDMQALRFDLVLQMQDNGTIANSMIMLWGAQQVAGFYVEGAYRPNEPYFCLYPEAEHEIRRLMILMDYLGIPLRGEALEFPIGPAEFAEAEGLRREGGLTRDAYIVLHAGAHDPRRRWPPEHFAALADDLAARGYPVVLAGEREEAGVTAQVAERMHYPAVNLAGRASLGASAAIVDSARLLVTNDSGMSHIAAALRKESVVIFSPYSDPARWAPLDHTRHQVITAEEARRPAYVLGVVHAMLGIPREVAAEGGQQLEA